mmetsp:Transcript_51131/g.108851  ORF Transcript_51131/g.108851 Transcript_51131/m.108851 type:complete len:153 (-) Transcript_51131:49-507(-)
MVCNAFIVGIDQIYEKDIDELNKSFLPVKSGEMSKNAAWRGRRWVSSTLSGRHSCEFPIVMRASFLPWLLLALWDASDNAWWTSKDRWARRRSPGSRRTHNTKHDELQLNRRGIAAIIVNMPLLGLFILNVWERDKSSGSISVLHLSQAAYP